MDSALNTLNGLMAGVGALASAWLNLSRQFITAHMVDVVLVTALGGALALLFGFAATVRLRWNRRRVRHLQNQMVAMRDDIEWLRRQDEKHMLLAIRSGDSRTVGNVQARHEGLLNGEKDPAERSPL